MTKKNLNKQKKFDGPTYGRKDKSGCKAARTRLKKPRMLFWPYPSLVSLYPTIRFLIMTYGAMLARGPPWATLISPFKHSLRSM